MPKPQANASLTQVALRAYSKVPRAKRYLQMVADEVKYPFRFGLKDVVSYGISGLVVLVKALF